MTGLEFGTVTATGPNWQSETTSPELRVLIVTLQSGFIVYWARPGGAGLVLLVFAPFWPEPVISLLILSCWVQ